MNDRAATYRAFISYSHTDKASATWLHRALEAYRIPSKLVGHATAEGEVPARLTPIFRDRDELPAAGDLSDELRKALAQSRFLVVVASPAAAQSRWVDEEVRQFKHLHGEGRVLALIVSGRPGSGDATECFPPSMRFKLDGQGNQTTLPAEPIAADLREGGDGKRLAKLKLVAGLTGLPLDALVRRADALGRRARALHLVGEVRELRGNSEQALEAFRQAERTTAELLARDPDDTQRIFDHAQSVYWVGYIDWQRQQLDAAERSFREYDRLAARLVAREPDKRDWQKERASALTNLGVLFHERQRHAQAAANFRQALAMTRVLAEAGPADRDLQYNLAQAAGRRSRVCAPQRRHCPGHHHLAHRAGPGEQALAGTGGFPRQSADRSDAAVRPVGSGRAAQPRCAARRRSAGGQGSDGDLLAHPAPHVGALDADRHHLRPARARRGPWPHRALPRRFRQRPRRQRKRHAHALGHGAGDGCPRPQGGRRPRPGHHAGRRGPCAGGRPAAAPRTGGAALPGNGNRFDPSAE
ncbi:MAG: TIR domain-containing protein [Lysobacteraceae bacterium]|nr:MAG: TIR domain-containing protein [Xanthomonadaceae bacterium]